MGRPILIIPFHAVFLLIRSSYESKSNFFGRVENRLEFCKFILVRCWLTYLTLLVLYSGLPTPQIILSLSYFIFHFQQYFVLFNLCTFVFLYFTLLAPCVLALPSSPKWCCCHFSHHLLSTLEASNRLVCHKSFPQPSLPTLYDLVNNGNSQHQILQQI